MIVAPPGHKLVQWDLSQAESWIVAFSSRDSEMKRALLFGDIHVNTSIGIFDLPITTTKKDILPWQRYTGKKCNHALSYRMTVPRFIQVFNKEASDNGVEEIGTTEGNLYRKRWLDLYRNIPLWWSVIEEDLKKNNKVLINCYGQVRTFFEGWGNELFKQATAHIPQGTVSDHFHGAIHPLLGIPGGVVEVHNQFVETGKFRIVNDSHDSILSEIADEKLEEYIPQVTELLRRPCVINDEEFTIPVDCEYGERWGEFEKWKS